MVSFVVPQKVLRVAHQRRELIWCLIPTVFEMYCVAHNEILKKKLYTCMRFSTRPRKS